MSRAVWTWELLGADDRVLDRPLSPTFTSRFDAEAWLGEQWRDLPAQGVAAVRLTQEGAPVADLIALPRS